MIVRLEGPDSNFDGSFRSRSRITHKEQTVFLMRLRCVGVPHYARAQDVTAELPDVYDCCCGDLYSHALLETRRNDPTMTTYPDQFSPNEPMDFEETLLPHLDAAYNLARWLMRNDADAQDVVQEAYLRALRFFDQFYGANPRAWLLTIVRNTCYTSLRKNRTSEFSCCFDEAARDWESDEPDPETLQVMKVEKQLVVDAIEALPIEFREVMILREFEELSYKEIASVTRVPIGTVMSRLARARKRLLVSLSQTGVWHTGKYARGAELGQAEYFQFVN